MTQGYNTINRPGIMENFPAFFRLFYYYIMKTRPLQSAWINLIETVKNVLTMKQKQRIARYRVNHYLFRLQQMERVIEQNNTGNFSSGNILNHLR